nr:DUF6000 family protein [Streptomyces sp. NE5-10]
MASEVCYSGDAHCFARARFGTQADAEILTACLDRYLPRTDTSPAPIPPPHRPALRPARRPGRPPPADGRLGTRHADRFTEVDGLWDEGRRAK